MSTENITVKKMPASAKYVLEIPKNSLEKQEPPVHPAANLHSINGQTSSVMVVPHNNRLTTAWDCCILQYCRIAHFLKIEPDSPLSVIQLRRPPSLKKQSASYAPSLHVAQGSSQLRLHIQHIPLLFRRLNEC